MQTDWIRKRWTEDVHFHRGSIAPNSAIARSIPTFRRVGHHKETTVELETTHMQDKLDLEKVTFLQEKPSSQILCIFLELRKKKIQGKKRVVDAVWSNSSV